MADINSQLPVKLTDGTLTATIRDAGTNDALNVAVVDAAGNQITAFSGSGTQYTEDVAAAADPIGTALNLIRQDVLAALTTTDGDNVAARGTDKGELYVKHVDAIPISGTVAVTQSGTWDEVGINDSGNSITVDQPTGSNLHTVIDSGTLTTVTTVTAVTAITNALPAGTNAIGKLAANSGVDIGDVTIDNTAANPVPVYFSTPVVTGEFNDYDTTAAVAAAATDNHDYTVVTNARLKQITASSSGKMKVVLSVGPVASLVVKGTWFTSTANPNLDITFAQPIEVPNTSTGTIRIARTNLEASSMDLYSTALGIDS